MSKLIIHIVPVQDSGLKHRRAKTCSCKPIAERLPLMDQYTHQMVGSGPDEWQLHLTQRRAKQ
jgi:hypothetical protein